MEFMFSKGGGHHSGGPGIRQAYEHKHTLIYAHNIDRIKNAPEEKIDKILAKTTQQ
jgi:hypothetical protein